MGKWYHRDQKQSDGTTHTRHDVDVSKGISNGTLFTLTKIMFKNIEKIKYPKTDTGIVVPTTKASNIDFLILKHFPKNKSEGKKMIVMKNKRL